MKTILIVWIVALLCLNVFSQDANDREMITPSYYGFTGLIFIPTTQTLPKGDWSIAYKTKPGYGDDLTLVPYSVNVVFAPFSNNFEIALTNTYMYASFKEIGGVPYRNTLDSLNTGIPIVPSVKYRFMPRSNSNFNVSMALGATSPYGVYYVVDKFFNLNYLDATIHTGIATKLTTYHAWAGLTFAFGSRTTKYQRDYPTQLSIEGAWGGSLKQLNEKEESFIAFSIRHPWTASLFITAFYRIDQQPSLINNEVVEEKPTHKMGLGLSVIF
ncbi:MAG: hypothetical protein JW956_12595 [Calditrichaceae bacterium]|nr:hypothetical protein [Calditrichaceae bacterium]